MVVSTHYMPEAEMLCDRIAFLRKGEVVALDTPQNLKDHLGLGEQVVVTYSGQVNIEALKNLPGVLGLKSKTGRVEIMIDRSEDSVDRIVKLFRDASIQDINIKEPDLEDVFIELAR